MSREFGAVPVTGPRGQCLAECGMQPVLESRLFPALLYVTSVISLAKIPSVHVCLQRSFKTQSPFATAFCSISRPGYHFRHLAIFLFPIWTLSSAGQAGALGYFSICSNWSRVASRHTPASRRQQTYRSIRLADAMGQARDFFKLPIVVLLSNLIIVIIIL